MRAVYSSLTLATRHRAPREFVLTALVAGALSVAAQQTYASALSAVAESREPINPSKVVGGVSGTKDLEKLFWMCDYAATVSALDPHEFAMCKAVIEQLRLAKFGGDFDDWIEWHRWNKDAEHEVREAAGESGSCGQGDKP